MSLRRFAGVSELYNRADMTRGRISLFVVLLSALGLGGSAACRTPAPRPNVIFILLDTLRSDRLSSYGYGKPTTPNLDAFAKDGVLFEQARSQASCTFPSVNSMLTSRWPLHFLGQPGDRIGIRCSTCPPASPR